MSTKVSYPKEAKYMLDKALKLVWLTGMLLSGIGLLLMLISPGFGISISESWLREVGSVETNLYYIVVSHYIMSFLIIGSIFLSVGLTTVMYCFYKTRLLALEKHRTF